MELRGLWTGELGGGMVVGSEAVSLLREGK